MNRLRRETESTANQYRALINMKATDPTHHFFCQLRLNNIYALTNWMVEKKQGKAFYFKLSRMMRYVLYEKSKKEETLPSQEVNFINRLHWAAVMKMRLSTKSDLNNSDRNGPKEDLIIAPMLLLPFFGKLLINMDQLFNKELVGNLSQTGKSGWKHFPLKPKNHIIPTASDSPESMKRDWTERIQSARLALLISWKPFAWKFGIARPIKRMRKSLPESRMILNCVAIARMEPLACEVGEQVHWANCFLK